MSDSNTQIKDFTTRVRQLILRHKEIKQENAELYAMVDERDKQIGELKKQLEDMENRYKALMTARMLSIADSDIEQTRKKINKLIRTVNLCITQLSEQQ